MAAVPPGGGATADVSRRAELASIYTRIGRTYIRWAPSLLLLAVVVFVPLGLIHALTVHAEVGSFGFGAGIKLLAAIAAVLGSLAEGLLVDTRDDALRVAHEARDGDIGVVDIVIADAGSMRPAFPKLAGIVAARDVEKPGFLGRASWYAGQAFGGIWP